MSWRALIYCAVGYAATAFAQAPLPLANEELLRSARLWEARERGDMAQLALEKLVTARPDSPEALLELGELHLRAANIAAAQSVLQRLEQRFPNAEATRTFAMELRVATRDRLQLASIQRLLQLSRGGEARQALAQLFPDGAPNGQLGIEYFRILARTPDGWERAREGLQRLVAGHPDDPKYAAALARHLLDRPSTEAEGLRMLSALAQREDVRAREIDTSLGDALKRFGYLRAPADVLRTYSARHPEDAEARAALRLRTAIDTETQHLMRSAGAARDPARQRRNLSELQEALLATPAVKRAPPLAVGLLRLLRADDVERSLQLDAQTAAALEWGQRSRRTGMTNTTRSILEKDAAVAFARGDFERAIRLAEQLETASERETADALLATAARLDPGSSWLFETGVRRLVAAGRYDEALRQLEARPLTQRWTAATRDELWATTLDQRAVRSLAADDIAAARADLERAIELHPTYPWTRYRLAGLLVDAGERSQAKQLMAQGAARAPDDPEMRYAHALLLSSIDEPAAALTEIERVAPANRSEGMQALQARLLVQQARLTTRQQHEAGDHAGAQATLMQVEGIARTSPALMRDLALGWIDIDEPARGLELFDRYRREEPQPSKERLLAWAEVLNHAEDARVGAVLEELRADSSLTTEERQDILRWQRSADLRAIRGLQRTVRYADAAAELDALLARNPDDRALRIARAELDLAMGNATAARDRYASLVAEQPDDLDTRLAYVRALTEAGDRDLARLQLAGVAERAPRDDAELQLGLARRQLALDDTNGAIATLDVLLGTAPNRADALLLAGRAEAQRRHFAAAREYFARAERGADADADASAAARRAREAIDVRRQSSLEIGIEWRHKPGDSGVSQFDGLVIPSVWRYARDYERRFTLHADAVSVDAGRLSGDYDIAALLGTIQAAGPTAARRFDNDRQDGLALGLAYSTDAFAADIGTTPLGLLLPNVVGGVEWTPDFRELDVAIGLERRAVTSSVLSYAGMRDPISERKWGGIVETGPYVDIGLYRERYSLAGSLRATRLTGTHVPDNTFVGLRLAGDWNFFSWAESRAFAGVTVNVWRYDENLQSYTFGHGGYYSPESYVSVALPLEAQGSWRDWSYRVRASLSYSNSDLARAPFYPADPSLQAAAASSPLPSGFDAPFYDDDGGDGLSLSAYAAVERRISARLVMGAKLDIDRADYYEPTIFMIYVRHVFGGPETRVEVPPRPVAAY